MQSRATGAFSSALNFCQLVKELKRQGFRNAPSFEDALKAARQAKDNGLVSWMSEQDDHSQFEELLSLHWETPD